ncbi:SWIM zinc finger family protein [Trichocoleus sp. FACHB-591]|uniref:SWIM zinc finger family protein n=1 Tax=Trichocoleus sp. FACHB-591 TaxID=2692872 RepID=UPI0016879854|nr:SWIM zinc finger family protein [Trichocoleus sp. FACHB-591]MBD2093597.1 SWIM zinc finger family protein [Trichocoleus sp. FACHB-591]
MKNFANKKGDRQLQIAHTTHKHTTMLSNIFISNAAARRILKCDIVEQVRVMKNGAVQVTYRRTAQGSRCSTFLSRKAFEQDFIEFRKAGAKSIANITPWIGSDTHFSVRSASMPDAPPYTVVVEGDRHTCTCPDHQKQRDAGRENPCCKHGFAVATYLSSSLSARAGLRQVAKPQPVKRVLYYRSGPVIHTFTKVGNEEPKPYKTIRADELEWMLEAAQSKGWRVIDATPVINAPSPRQPYSFVQTSRGPVHV